MVKQTRNAQLDLAHDVASPREARRFIVTLMRGWGASSVTIDRTKLLVSELVSNAVLHGSGPVRLSVQELDAANGRVRIEVFSTGVGRPRRLRAQGGDLSGRGLQLVDELAQEWGSSSSDGEVRVWFELHAGMTA